MAGTAGEIFRIVTALPLIRSQPRGSLGLRLGVGIGCPPCVILSCFIPGLRVAFQAKARLEWQYSSRHARRSPVVCVIRPCLETGEMERLLYWRNLFS